MPPTVSVLATVAAVAAVAAAAAALKRQLGLVAEK
jgi:hypothetical protein